MPLGILIAFPALVIFPSRVPSARRHAAPCALNDWCTADDWPAEAELLAAQVEAKRAARAVQRAVSMEDYDAASRAQEQLTALRAADPLRSLRRQQAAAVSSEQYEEAASVQAALKRLRLARPRLLWRDEIAALQEELAT